MNIKNMWILVIIGSFIYILIKSIRFRKFLRNVLKQAIIVIVKMGIPIGLLEFLTEQHSFMLYNNAYIIVMLISGIISLRFLLRVLYNINFNSYKDLLCSLGAIYIFLDNLNNNVKFDKLIEYIFKFNTSSYVLQIFIFHMYLLINIFLFVSGFITISTLSIQSCIPFIENMLGDEIRAVKLLIRKVILCILFINNKIEKIICFNCIKYVDNYINPLKRITITPLYKNIPKLKLIFLFVYLITGILVINYWNDLIYYSKFNISIPNEKMDSFSDYRLIFIIPLLGIFINNVFKKEEKKMKNIEKISDKEENFEIQSSIFN